MHHHGGARIGLLQIMHSISLAMVLLLVGGAPSAAAPVRDDAPSAADSADAAPARTARVSEPAQPAHHHAALGGAHDHGGGSATRIALSLGMLAASYRSPLYEGDYQGTTVGARVSRGRVALAGSLAAYRIDRNGATVNGLGDAMLHAHATVLARDALSAGVMVMGSLPTGDDQRGLGMGHVMVMSEAWAAWTPSRLAITASAGYARMLDGAAAHAKHGAPMWPLVDPMNARELPFEGLAMAALGPVGVGAHLLGALPLGTGTTRLSAGARVAWTVGRLTATAELGRGLVGDPFELRGVLEAAVRLP